MQLGQSPLHTAASSSITNNRLHTAASLLQRPASHTGELCLVPITPPPLPNLTSSNNARPVSIPEPEQVYVKLADTTSQIGLPDVMCLVEKMSHNKINACWPLLEKNFTQLKTALAEYNAVNAVRNAYNLGLDEDQKKNYDFLNRCMQNYEKKQALLKGLDDLKGLVREHGLALSFDNRGVTAIHEGLRTNLDRISVAQSSDAFDAEVKTYETSLRITSLCENTEDVFLRKIEVLKKIKRIEQCAPGLQEKFNEHISEMKSALYDSHRENELQKSITAYMGYLEKIGSFFDREVDELREKGGEPLKRDLMVLYAGLGQPEKVIKLANEPRNTPEQRNTPCFSLFDRDPTKTLTCRLAKSYYLDKKYLVAMELFQSANDAESLHIVCEEGAKNLMDQRTYDTKTVQKFIDNMSDRGPERALLKGRFKLRLNEKCLRDKIIENYQKGNIPEVIKGAKDLKVAFRPPQVEGMEFNEFQYKSGYQYNKSYMRTSIPSTSLNQDFIFELAKCYISIGKPYVALNLIGIAFKDDLEEFEEKLKESGLIKIIGKPLLQSYILNELSMSCSMKSF